MANLLPLLFIGGGAVYLLTSKKNGKKKKKLTPNELIGDEIVIIDKGSYRYSSDCQHVWVANKDITDPKIIFTNEDEAALATFHSSTIAAVTQTLSEMGPSPMPMIEASVRTIAKLVPECRFVEGRPAPKVALALLPIVVSFASVQIAEAIGMDTATFMEQVRKEMYLMSQAPGFSERKVDLMALINRERANPSDIEVPPTFDPEGMVG